MDEKIKKLLDSDNIDDLKISWELLKSKNIPVDSEDWWPYFNIFYLSHHESSSEIGELQCMMIKEIYTDWQSNRYWNKWSRQAGNLKTIK